MASDRYALELAGTVVKLFQDGISDPSYWEIAEAHWAPGGDRALGREIPNGVQERLPKIKTLVEDVYEAPCALVSEGYYDEGTNREGGSYRDAPPRDMVEAYACLPGGYHKKSYGIRVHGGDSDLIWRATVERNLISAAGKEKKGVDRVLAAVASEDISDENALSLIQELRTRAAPERPEIIQRLFDELGRGEDENGDGDGDGPPELGPVT